jgi:tetratricopeptide (TPR) repeat protein
MNRTIFRLFFISFFTFFFCIQVYAQSSSDIKREAMRLFLQDQNSLALEKINQALKVDSINPEFYDIRACINEKFKKYDEAYNDIAKALSLNPHYLYAYLHKAIFLLNEFKYQQSINTSYEGLKYCNETDSIKFNFYNNLGIAYHFLNDFQNSISAYKLALQLSPNDLNVLVNLASVQNKSGSKMDAINTLKKVIELDSLKPEAYNNLGMRYLEMGDYWKAIDNFSKSISLSNSGISYNNRGFCYYKLGKLDAALADINTSIRLAPVNPYSFRNRALVYITLGKKILACDDLKKAEDLGYSKMFDNQVIELINANCTSNATGK